MEQIARNVTDWDTDILRHKRFLIVDRDSEFSPRFKSILEGSGIEILMTAYQAPNMNAHAERYASTSRTTTGNGAIRGWETRSQAGRQCSGSAPSRQPSGSAGRSLSTSLRHLVREITEQRSCTGDHLSELKRPPMLVLHRTTAARVLRLRPSWVRRMK